MNTTKRTICPECGRPVARGSRTHSVTHRAGSRAGLVHREATSTWHESCWLIVESFAAESRARAEAARLADIRAAMTEALGRPFDGEVRA